MNIAFKVGKILESPVILLANSKCSEIKCPANGLCDEPWQAIPSSFTGSAVSISSMTIDHSITLSCTG